MSNNYLLISGIQSPMRDVIISKGNISVFKYWRDVNIIELIIRKLFYLLNIKVSWFYGDWRNVISKFSTIIVCAQHNREMITYICSKRRKGQRIIVWYWNPVSCCVKPDELRILDCELWSFDSEDCRKYGLNFNTTYYFKDINLPVCHNNKYDVFFCGINKGRKKRLNEIQAVLSKNGLTSLIYLVDEELPVSKRLPYLSYEEYLNKLSAAKAILDVLQDGQEGMTLRVMEALYFNKKLITTQVSIVKEDFYNADNIFIIGKDNWVGIKDFMSRPVIKTPEEILDKYDFFTWLKRFDQNNNKA